MRTYSLPFDSPSTLPEWKRAMRSLPVFFAWCEIRRQTRRYARLGKDKPLTLVLVLPPRGDLEAYSTAARVIFEKHVSYRADGDFSCVMTLEPKRTDFVRSSDEGKMRAARRMVVVTVDSVAVPDWFRITADAVLDLEPPCARHLLVAARRVLKVAMSPEQALRLEDEHVDTLTAVLRTGRSVSRSIILAGELQAARATTVTGPKLEELHGMGEAGEWGEDLARDLGDWRAGLIPWSDVDKGILVSGPPGTGKTTFAAALARSCNAHLVLGSVARWQAKGNLNHLLQAMRDAFDEARARAPSILFLDELDAVGDRERFSGDNRQYSTEVVAGLLECMDGVEGRDGVVVVGATNNPGAIDAALRRPGRLDRHVSMPLPDGAAREGILRHHLREDLPGHDLSGVKAATAGWTGADLERLVRDARRLARRGHEALAVAHLDRALPARVTMSTDDLWRTAVHEAGHVVVGETLFPGCVRGAAIFSDFVPDGGSGQESGGTMLHAPTVLHSTTDTLLDHVALLLAGGVAEELVLGTCSTAWSTGRDSDIQRATVEAVRIEACFGLGRDIAALADPGDAEELTSVLRQDREMRRRVRQCLETQMARVRGILMPRQAELRRVAAVLRDHGRIGRHGVAMAIGHRLH